MCDQGSDQTLGLIFIKFSTQVLGYKSHLCMFMGKIAETVKKLWPF